MAAPQFDGIDFPSEAWLIELHKTWVIPGNTEIDYGNYTEKWGPNVAHLLFLILQILDQNLDGYEFTGCGDYTGDGSISIIDVIALANCMIAENCTGPTSYDHLNGGKTALMEQS